MVIRIDIIVRSSALIKPLYYAIINKTVINASKKNSCPLWCILYNIILLFASGNWQRILSMKKLWTWPISFYEVFFASRDFLICYAAGSYFDGHKIKNILWEIAIRASKGHLSNIWHVIFKMKVILYLFITFNEPII